MMRSLALGALAALLWLSSAAEASARACGDTVPCACGDVLVASRTLSVADPITQAPCERSGLLVQIPPAQVGATLDLGGFALGGQGRGFGIHVQAGGDGGFSIVGPGVVRGFDVGIHALTAVRTITNVTVTGNRSDGLRVTGGGVTVSGCEASANGGNGFVLRGSDYHLEGNRAATNGRHGFWLGGRRATATRNEAMGNAADGLAVAGREHAVDGTVVTANGQAGLSARVARTAISTTTSAGNGRAALQVFAHDSVFGTPTGDGAIRARGARLEGRR